MTAAGILGVLLLANVAGGTTPGKLAPGVAKEMTEAILAVNKALGLESWPARGAHPCVDRGGQGINVKDVTAEDARKCAATALEKGLPELGKSYVLAIPMAAIGPVTVLAFGVADSAGWGAYSCDPERKCAPVKLALPAKWSKRVSDRQAKACADATTIWFPADGATRGCPGSAPPTTAAAPPAPSGASAAEVSKPAEAPPKN